MKTIASTVAAYVKTKPYLSAALSDGIINLTSLARKIKPQIETSLKKTVNQGAIVMSLKRVSDEAEFTSDSSKILSVLKNMGDITVRSSLVDYSFSISDTLLLNQSNLLKEIEHKKEVFYTSSRGVNETNIVISASVEQLIETVFKNEKLTHKIENLSSITVKLPQVNISTPGVYYYIFQRLAWEGIIIHEVISTTNEFTIIVSDDQIDVAFKVIKDLKNVFD
mgnify:CR=1 FL=1